MLRPFLALACCLAGLCAARAVEPDDPQPDPAALAAAGRTREAFLACLATPGMGCAAVRLGRSRAEEALGWLLVTSDSRPPGTGELAATAIRRALVRCDLLLALDRREEALDACRRAAALTVVLPWYRATAPAFYPVEPSDGFGDAFRPVAPFVCGPGSHRDNWLLRRLIALEAWDEARAEFARVWELHRGRAQPAVFVHDGTDEAVLVEADAFDALGMQFALDYAYFLKRRDRLAEGLAVLREVLSSLDLDRDPNRPTRRVVDAAEASELPRRAGGAGAAWFARLAGGTTRKEFIRLAYGAHRQAGERHEATLVAALEEACGDAVNRTWRVLARVRSLQGDVDAATALELEYLSAQPDPLTRAWRRALLMEELHRPEAARDAYREALALVERWRGFAAKEARGEGPPEDLPGGDNRRAQEMQREWEGYEGYRRALALRPPPPRLPDPDESLALQCCSMQRPRAVAVHGSAGSGPDLDALAVRLCIELERIHAGLGEDVAAARMLLRACELDPRRLEGPGELDRACDAADLALANGHRVWLAGIRPRVTGRPRTAAEILWKQGKTEEALDAVIAAIAKVEGRFPWRPWHRRLADDQPRRRRLLEAVVAAEPDDLDALHALLALDGISEDDRIELLEAMLAGDGWRRWRLPGKGETPKAETVFAVAHRLLLAYERAARSRSAIDTIRTLEAKLVALGFAILEGKPPYERQPDLLAGYRACWNDSFHGDAARARDLLTCLYAWLPHLDELQAAPAAKLAATTRCLPLVNQLARLTGGERRDPSAGLRHRWNAVTVTRAGVADDLTVLSHRDDVRCFGPLTATDTWIGVAWGAVRYRSRGDDLEIHELLLGGRVSCFADTPHGLFAGGRNGLHRIDEAAGDAPSCRRIGLESLRDEPRFRTSSYHGAVTKEDAWADPVRIDHLLWWGDRLWIRSGDGVFAYDPARNACTDHGRQGGRLFPAGDTLYTDRARYDAAADRFVTLGRWETPYALVGATRHEIWADVRVADPLRHRPGIYDPATDRVRVLAITDPPPEYRQLTINGDIEILHADDEHVWLDGHGTVLVYDRTRSELHPLTPARGRTLGLPRRIVECQFPHHSRTLFRLDLATGARLPTTGPVLDGDRGPVYVRAERPDGTTLIGAAIVREWWADNLGFAGNDGMHHHVQDLEGGLFAVDAAGGWTKLGSPAGEIADHHVNRIVPDTERGVVYLCTDGGLSVLALPDFVETGRITVSDGLPANRVSAVARIGERLFIGCEHGDEMGGLAVHDLGTGLIRNLDLADGLRCRKIHALAADGHELRIGYGALYRHRMRRTPEAGAVPAPPPPGHGGRTRTNGDVVTFPASILDTRTMDVRDGEGLEPAPAPPDRSRRLPCLGGAVLCKAVVTLSDGSVRHLYGGEHGLVVAKERLELDAYGLDVGRLPIPAPTADRALQRAARGVRVRVEDPIELAPFLDHDNPYVRLRALRLLRSGDLAPVEELRVCGERVLELADADPHPAVRSEALYILADLDLVAVPRTLFVEAAASGDLDLALAGMTGLARQGERWPAAELDRFLRRLVRHGHLRHAERLLGFLADRADVAILCTFARHAIGGDVGKDWHRRLLERIGRRLRAEPALVEPLLADAAGGRGYAGRYSHTTGLMLEFAGKAILPHLHAGLANPDRVVRANAARGCGAIGDPSSVEPLLDALDLESGLSRAAVVTALGQLQDPAALPRLAELYVDAKADDRRRAGAGFRIAQAQVAMQAAYTHLANLDALGSEWNELDEAARGRPHDPRREEHLLTARLVLDAVAAIGGRHAVGFYRTLAAGEDVAARREAALHLAEAADADRARNRQVLASLLRDRDAGVRATAAASLLATAAAGADDAKVDAAEETLLRLLAGEKWKAYQAVSQLDRLDAGRLAFARTALKRLAAQRAWRRHRWDRDLVGRLLAKLRATTDPR